MQRPNVLVSVLVVASVAGQSVEFTRALSMSEREQQLASSACMLIENATLFYQFLEDTIERHSVFEDSSQGLSINRASAVYVNARSVCAYVTFGYEIHILRLPCSLKFDVTCFSFNSELYIFIFLYCILC